MAVYIHTQWIDKSSRDYRESDEIKTARHQNNQLTSLPESIGNLTDIKNLTNLRLWLNRISYIKEFKSSKNGNTMLTSRVLKLSLIHI